MKIVVVLLVLAVLSSIASAQQYTLVPAYPNVPAFIEPLAITQPDDGTNRMFVVEQLGKIYSVVHSDTSTQKKIFLDVSPQLSFDGPECGLLGLTFHPNFRTNHYCYISATEYGQDSAVLFTIKRYSADPQRPDTVLAGSELTIFSFELFDFPHHGGTVLFGPDGYLYVAIGDGTPDKIDSSTGFAVGDWYRTAQDKKKYYGKILRIDVNHTSEGREYAIPSDNPFVDSSFHTLPEIYAIGFRNPWKFSFDHEHGTLWLGDVGNLLYEEIDTIVRGGNYGWSVMEGFHRNNDWNIDTSAMKLPLLEYPHFNSTGSNSVTGGYVYRGKGFKDFAGKYIYGDFISGSIWAMDFDGLATPVNRNLLDTPQAPRILISSFGEDLNQELYVVSYYDGVIYKFTYPLTVATSLVREKDNLRLNKSITSSLEPAPTAYFTLAEAGQVKLSLVDITGREVKTIVSHHFTAGAYNCPVDVRGLSGGIYLLRFEGQLGSCFAKLIVR